MDADAADLDRWATMLANRVRKNARRLRKAFRREGIEAYRLYDRDIPEIRAAVDRYGDHLVFAEYVREQTARFEDWAGTMARAVGEALALPEANVHVRQRRTGHRGRRYDRQGHRGQRIVVRERSLSFHVNLTDYVDTGLFNDARELRRLVGEDADDARFLNLFGYTGTVTCAAAAGGARQTTTVDASDAYLDWARDNLVLNGLEGSHRLLRADVREYLDQARREGARFERIYCDPPSFSSTFGGGTFDVLRDHRSLVEACLERLTDDGVLWFVTNHQRFVPDLGGLDAVELSPDTVPVDYRNRSAHRAFRIAR
jgi:23S rRNA (cytosine1962-C5)-methyltransferase